MLEAVQHDVDSRRGYVGGMLSNSMEITYCAHVAHSLYLSLSLSLGPESFRKWTRGHGRVSCGEKSSKVKWQQSTNSSSNGFDPWSLLILKDN